MSVGQGTQWLVGLAVAALVLAGGLLVGLQVLTGAGSTPDVTLTVADAADTYRLESPGVVDLVTITHDGGAALNVSAFRITIGSAGGGMAFDAADGWRTTSNGATFAVRRDGEVLAASGEPPLRQGDVLTVSRMEGQVPSSYRPDATVTVVYRPSYAELVRATVTLD